MPLKYIVSFICLFLITVMISACGAGADHVSGSSTTPTVSAQNANPVEIAAALDGNDRIMVWTAAAAAPGAQRADNTGDVAFMDEDAALSPIIKVPNQANRVEACGQQALSPSGEHYALFMGLDTNNGGDLYLITNGGEPITLSEDMQYLGCSGGNGRLKFSPDSKRVAYMLYEPDARASEFADGTLQINSTDHYSVLASFTNTVSFDISNDGVAYVRFFTNESDLADEASIAWWDGSSDSEITTITAHANCRFTSSYTQIAPNGLIWMVLGERCSGRGTEWQLHRIDPEAEMAFLGLTQAPRGAMASFSEVNNLFFSTDGSVIYYTLPDGVSANSTALYAVNIDDLIAPRALFERSVIVPNYSGTENTGPLLSPNKEWLAFVVSTPDRKSDVYVLDLRNPAAEPQLILEGNIGDSAPYMQFSLNGERLVFVHGGKNGADNSLYLYQTGSELAERIRRSTYSGWATLSPTGNEVALLEWQPIGSNLDSFVNMTVVELSSTESSTLLVGGEVVDNRLQNPIFARPLVWLR